MFQLTILLHLYDVLSFEGTAPNPDAERFVEAKATSGEGMEFEISQAEWTFAELKRHQHLLFRITQVTSAQPGCRQIRDIVGESHAGRVRQYRKRVPGETR